MKNPSPAKIVTRLLHICLVITSLLLTDAYAAQTSINVGYEENPPIAFTNKTGVPTGISVDLLNYIAKQEGWRINWKPCLWEKCLAGLSSGKIDFLAGIGHSKEREALYSFTMEPVLLNWGQLYAAKNQKVSSILNLEGKRIALVPADAHGKAFTGMLTSFGVTARIEHMHSYGEAVRAVVAGHADACVVSCLYPISPVEANKIDQTPVIFNPMQNAYATSKGNHLALLQTIDRDLVRLKADKSSFYYRNSDHWLGIPVSRAIPHWVWWFMAGGTLLFGTAMGFWRYNGIVRLSNELSESRQNLRTVFDNTDKGIIIHNQQGHIIAVNRPALILYGATEDELLSSTVLDLTAETEERHQQLPVIMAEVAAGVTLKMEWLCRNVAEKRSFNAEIFYTAITWNNEPALMGMVQDITKRKQRDSLIQRLTIAVEQSANTVVITDKDGLIQYANASFERMSGYTVEEARGKTSRVLKSGIHPPEYYKNIWETILSGKTWQGYFCNKRKDGKLFWESATITPVRQDSREITHFVAIKEDITQRKLDEEELYRQANYDTLTGLPNRNMLVKQITETINDTTRSGNKVMLLFLDLNNFDTIISAFGHSVADSLLQAVAGRLVSSVGNGDMVARFGIDEFAIAPLRFCADGQENCVAPRLMNVFEKPFVVQGQEFFISTSMGVAHYPDDGANAEELLRSAAAAMYQALKRGHNSFERYNHGLNSKTSERLVMATLLRRALERQEFIVYYQPQQELATGRINALEALLRWQPQEGPLISPVEFIPILEDTGMIIQVGEWVLREVCNQIKRWLEVDIDIRHASVNVSFLQFQRPDIVERITAIISEAGIDPARICLELTESIMMKEPEDTLQKLNALRAAGVSLSMDDFGTGYSSLAYLRRMPLNELKIDRSFIMTLPESNTTLVNTILGMARSLGLRVVAEGVETAEQLDYLQQHGCESMQGFLLSRPLPMEQFEQFIQKNSQPYLAEICALTPDTELLVI
ncbi:MAG: EAL domain-containing protein [Deltaproteobacteria bacterium]|nr:EAL domain-containing protein [Deltaproteobacteria bacterium]